MSLGQISFEEKAQPLENLKENRETKPIGRRIRTEEKWILSEETVIFENEKEF